MPASEPQNLVGSGPIALLRCQWGYLGVAPEDAQDFLKLREPQLAVLIIDGPRSITTLCCHYATEGRF